MEHLVSVIPFPSPYFYFNQVRVERVTHRLLAIKIYDLERTVMIPKRVLPREDFSIGEHDNFAVDKEWLKQHNLLPA